MTDSPWGPTVPARHLLGSYWWVDFYPAYYWWVTAALCLAVPPAGVFVLAYLCMTCVVHEGTTVAVEITPAQ